MLPEVVIQDWSRLATMGVTETYCNTYTRKNLSRNKMVVCVLRWRRFSANEQSKRQKKYPLCCAWFLCATFKDKQRDSKPDQLRSIKSKLAIVIAICHSRCGPDLQTCASQKHYAELTLGDFLLAAGQWYGDSCKDDSRLALPGPPLTRGFFLSELGNLNGEKLLISERLQSLQQPSWTRNEIQNLLNEE